MGGGRSGMCGRTCLIRYCEQSENVLSQPDNIAKLKSTEDKVRVHTYISLALL